jgi:hypothetical protein
MLDSLLRTVKQICDLETMIKVEIFIEAPENVITEAEKIITLIHLIQRTA